MNSGVDTLQWVGNERLKRGHLPKEATSPSPPFSPRPRNIRPSQLQINLHSKPLPWPRPLASNPTTDANIGISPLKDRRKEDHYNHKNPQLPLLFTQRESHKPNAGSDLSSKLYQPGTIAMICAANSYVNEQTYSSQVGREPGTSPEF